MTDDKAPNKLRLYLLGGDQLTPENFSDFFKRLTGKDMSEQGMARLRALLDKPASE